MAEEGLMMSLHEAISAKYGLISRAGFSPSELWLVSEDGVHFAIMRWAVAVSADAMPVILQKWESIADVANSITLMRFAEAISA